tara:strand:- start:910 stop:1275 length:366 start_codon:yes stop_codon:yes gene_type:complete
LSVKLKLEVPPNKSYNNCMMNEIDNRTDKEYRFEMTQLIRAEIIAYIQEGAKNTLDNSNPDIEQWDMIVNDAEDLRIVHIEIDRDNIPYAFSHACDLDTAVRDVIPQKVWNWMSKVHATAK